MTKLRHATLATPLGELLAVRSERGLVLLAFPEEDARTALAETEDTIGARSLEDAAGFDRFARELAEYFDGRRRSFRTSADLSAVRGFARRVLEEAGRIPYGAVATYGELAARAGSPRAARAAGNAMRNNPVPILVPCHRVLPADGSLGGYGGREDRKAFLLELEETRVRPRIPSDPD